MSSKFVHKGHRDHAIKVINNKKAEEWYRQAQKDYGVEEGDEPYILGSAVFSLRRWSKDEYKFVWECPLEVAEREHNYYYGRAHGRHGAITNRTNLEEFKGILYFFKKRLDELIDENGKFIYIKI